MHTFPFYYKMLQHNSKLLYNLVFKIIINNEF